MHADVLEGRSLHNVMSRLGISVVTAQKHFNQFLKLAEFLGLGIALHLFVECIDSRVESC